MMKSKFAFFLIASSLLSFGMFQTSCQKKTDCDVAIHCVDTAGVPMGGVAVLLYANVKTQGGATVQADLKAQSTTDASGYANFTFKLPAILDVKATRSSQSGAGIVKLEEGQKVQKELVVK